MPDADVFEWFKKIASDHTGIRLLNVFKGLPISYDTNISAVGVGEIRVPGSRSHVACLYYQGESYLRSDVLPFVVRSKVKSLNLDENYAVLWGFEIARENIGMRKQIRVETDENMIATVQFKNSAFEFKTPLVDISDGGASVYFENYLFPFRICQPGAELTMSIPIPDFAGKKIKARSSRNTAPLKFLQANQSGDIHITAHGTVVAVRPEANRLRYRVSAQLYFKEISRMVIVQYIRHRQTEIIKDLRVLTDNLYNGKK